MGWSDLIGRQLGQYAIVDELGRGGSSRVYRAEDLDLSREVAIKVILNDAEDRVGFVRRFEREVQAVAQLDHPNIVSVYDRGQTDDLVYLVMQCVTGGTLRQRGGRPIPIAEATATIYQMSMALHHAHQNGIIHRDVKPSNMLVDASDTRYVLLTDFGIAKLQGMLGLTKSGTTIGTPEYMSPEQAEGKDIDQRTDVYALGCVLFELLAGRTPFVGSTSVSVLYQQVHQRPPHLRAFNSDVPRELGRIVEQALAKRPEDRFGTAALLAEALYPYSENRVPSLPGLITFPPTLPRATTASTVPPASPGSAAAATTTSDATAAGAGPSAPPRDAGRAASGPLAPLPAETLSVIAPVGADVRPVLPPPDSAWQPAASSSDELVPPTPESWHGLGAEGLDAIFPDDPEAQLRQEARVEAISNTPTVEEMPVVSPPPGSGSATSHAASSARPRPAVQRDPSRSIPLPSFRLPSKQTLPLNLPVTDSGQLDLEALMAQVESQQRAAQAERPEVATPAETVVGGRAGIPSMELPPAARRAAVPPVRRSPPPSRRPGRDKTRRRPQRPSFLLAAIIAAILSILLVLGVLVSAFALGLHPPGQTSATPTATAIPTMTPSPSPSTTRTVGPSATATLSPQQVVNNEAAAAFASVTLATFDDPSCSRANQTTRFSSGQWVYINLCTSNGPIDGLVTVAISQGGTIVHYMANNQYLNPNASYYYYEQYGLSSGTYHMVVTMPINGKTAVARDLVFTVS